MAEKEKVAIVILNWNGVSLFQQFLPSVLQHSSGEGISVYVADNGSSDGSLEFLRENFPQVKQIALNANHGFAQGYNLALQQVDADFFVLLNSDIEVTPGWLSPCLERLQADPRLAALQPKIRSFREQNRFEYAGAGGGYLDWLGYPFCRGRILSETEPDTGQYDHPYPIFWATGACLFIRAAVFKQSGGFDGDFFAHMEEIDLCWRLKNQGWQIGYEPGSVVYHLGGATLSYQSPQKVYLNFRNNLWMLLKNLPAGRILPLMLMRLVLDGVAAISFLAGGNRQAFAAVFRAHMAVYRTLGRFLKKRKELLPLVKQSRHPEIYRGSIVWRFYIRKHRKYSDLNFYPEKEKKNGQDLLPKTS